MLARYLRSQDRPVRYAMDPAHLAAIQNMLRMQTRAHDVPFYQHTAQDELRPAHQQYPAAPHAMASLLATGDPGDLMAYLDLMEQAGHPAPQVRPGYAQAYFGLPRHQRMLADLGGLHRQATAMGADPRHPLVYGYSADALTDPSIQRWLAEQLNTRRSGRGGTETLADLLNAFHRNQRFVSGQRASEEVMRTLRGGDVHGLSDLYDLSHSVHSDMYDYESGGPHPWQRGVAANVRGHAANMLEDLHERLGGV